METLIHEHLFEGLTVKLKNCNKCKRDLPEAYFSKASGGRYLRSACRECESDLGKVRESIKRSAPPVPDNHICPICKRNEEQVKGEGGKNLGAWVVDHDHDTDEFRGYLCHTCNRALGSIDTVEKLKAAIEYLESQK
jgi:hypothetical protein